MSHPTIELDSPSNPLHARHGSFLGAFATQAFFALKGALSAARDAREEALRDASAVRLMAHRYRQSDRGFAADLDAAADRHEEAIAQK